MTDDPIFGPDHDREPGITPVPGQLPPQIVECMVESAALHSRSRGWLPAVVIRIATADGAGLAGSIEAGPEILEIARHIVEAHERAQLDVRRAIADGTLRER